MATATTIPTAPQNTPITTTGVLRGRGIDPTPTLFPDVPDHRDSGPDALLPPGFGPNASALPVSPPPPRALDFEPLRFRPRAVLLDGESVSRPLIRLSLTAARDTRSNTWKKYSAA